MPDLQTSNCPDHATRQAGAIFSLVGEVALVTGASSGLGRRFAKVLAANGASLALAGRREPEPLSLAAEIRIMGGVAVAAAFDLRDRDRIPRIFSQVETELGPPTIVVNNAGFSAECPVADLDFASWRDILDVDLDALFLTSREAARCMAPKGAR
jgi:3-oxoacyl-[acyl-carrier protein] reductase